MDRPLDDFDRAQWVIQQLREGFPFTPSARYLIHDRDTKFSAAVKGWIKALGLKSVQTAFRAPWRRAAAPHASLQFSHRIGGQVCELAACGVLPWPSYPLSRSDVVKEHARQLRRFPESWWPNHTDRF
jgi:hypothetical protein